MAHSDGRSRSVGGAAKRRRVNTRQRLIDAAFATFAELGFGQTTVQHVCDAAGFTRGAFYSNYSSLDDLYMDVWQQESRRMVEHVRTVGQSIRATQGLSMHQAITQIDALMPISVAWFRVSTEFIALATRRTELLPMMQARESAIRAELGPVLEAFLAHLRRRAPDVDELCSAIVAAHEGTLIQLMTEPEPTAVRERRATLFHAVIERYTHEM